MKKAFKYFILFVCILITTYTYHNVPDIYTFYVAFLGGVAVGSLTCMLDE